MTTQFRDWCHEIIIQTDNDSMTRGQMIRRFIRDGVYSFCAKHGWVLYEALDDEIASGIYRHSFSFRRRNLAGAEEFAWWSHTVPFESWWEFFEIWCQRLPELEGLESEFQLYIWKQTNVGASAAIRRILPDDDANSDSDSGDSVDPYLRETTDWAR